MGPTTNVNSKSMPGRKNFIGTDTRVRYVTPRAIIERNIKIPINSSPTEIALIPSVPSIDRMSVKAITFITTAILLPLSTFGSNL
jgi:hypothetical protein